MDSVVNQILLDGEERAKRLASGRGCTVASMKPPLGDSVEEVNDRAIYLALWRLSQKEATPFSREQSDDAFLVNVMDALIQNIRQDAEARFSETIAQGLKAVFGTDKAASLVGGVADAMELRDQYQ